MDNMDDIYNTELYTEFSDLPKATQKAFYAEFRKSGKEENKVYILGIVVPVVFVAVICGFLIASIFLYIFRGMDLLFVSMLICACLVLLGFIIVKAWLDRVKTEHELRFSHWLKVNKHVIAELKAGGKK